MMNKEEYGIACKKFNIDPNTYGREFYMKGKKYRVVGINSRARTLPVIGEEIGTKIKKAFGKDILEISPTRPIVDKFDENKIGAKFDYNGEKYEIVRYEKNIFTTPVVAMKLRNREEYSFGIWTIAMAIKEE